MILPGWWAPVVADFDARVRRFLVSLAARGISARVSSGVRSLASNRAAGGDPMSQHLVGTARDLVPVNTSYAELAQLARDSRLFGFVQDESNRPGHGPHVHVQLFQRGQLSSELFDRVAT